MDTGNLNEYLKFFITIVAVVNPMGVIPIFINLTVSQTVAERNKTAWTSAIAVGTILLVVLFSGETLLHFFGISVASFSVGGGLLVILMAIAMLNAKTSNIRQTEEEKQDSAERDNVAVVPLATPLLAGPGAISTVILHAQRYHSHLHYLYLSLALIALTAVIALLFYLAPPISRLLGKTGINIITRLMGLIMAAMGVEFMASGLKSLFPILG